MIKQHLPFDTNLKKRYQNYQVIKLYEGGGCYFGMKNDKYYVIYEEGTLADFIDEGDSISLNKLITEHEFTDKTECLKFIKKLPDNPRSRYRIIIPKELE